MYELLLKTVQEATEMRREAAVVVCGTGYIMPEVRAAIGIVEPRDDLDLKRKS